MCHLFLNLRQKILKGSFSRVHMRKVRVRAGTSSDTLAGQGNPSFSVLTQHHSDLLLGEFLPLKMLQTLECSLSPGADLE